MLKLFISESSEKHKYEVAGSAEYYNRKSGRMQTLKFDPIIVNGVSEAQAINNAKFKLRKKYNLPIDTKLAIFDHTIKIIDSEVSPEQELKSEPKCDKCNTRLTDAGDCPKCDLLDDRYDEGFKAAIKEAVESSINISEFIGLTKQEIDNKLDILPIGTRIIGVRDSSGRYDFDTHIEKQTGKKANYFTPVGSPNEYKYTDTWWTVGGYEQPYITRIIYEVVNDINKYYVMTKNELPTIYGYMLHSEMTDMCFVGCHKDEQILRTCENAIETFVMQTYETEEEGEKILASLNDKGIILGWDEYYDGKVWHELVDDPELTNAKSPMDSWAINMSTDIHKPNWYKVNIIDVYSARF